MKTYEFKLTLKTERPLSRDQVINLLQKLVEIGQDDAQETCDDPDMEQAARDEADDALSLEIDII